MDAPNPLVPYQYSSVSTETAIRVLQIQPGAGDQDIRGELVEIDLETKPTYAALSYCWGEPKFNHALLLGTGVLYITESLAGALKSLRSPSNEVVIWADAVCINQQDIPERNVQVGLMSRIYTQAQHVHIYLGEPSPADIPGLTQVPRFAEAQDQRMAKKDTRDRFQLAGVGLESYNLPDTNSPAYESFLAVCRRPYFSRGWVLQEAALARSITIHCGTFSFPFDEFYRGLLCICELGFANNVPVLQMLRVFRIGLMRQAIARGVREDLLTLLVQTRLSETTDARDKVYALLGIAGDSGVLQINPNYGVDWKEVYKSVVVRMVECYHVLDVLCVPKSDEAAALVEDETPHGSETEKLPSWVPDWRRNAMGEAITLTGRDQDNRLLYCAAGDSRARIRLNDSGKNLLGLFGYCVDRIVECGAPYDNIDKHIDQSSAIQMIRDRFSFGLELRLRYIEWKHVARAYTRGKYVTGTETHEDAFWRSLVAGYAFKPDTDFAAVKKLYQEWNASLLRFGRLKSWLPRRVFEAIVFLKLVFHSLRTMFALAFWLPLYSRKGEDFAKLMQGVGHRRLVRTEKGYVGIVPKRAEIGDVVALFEGGNLPFILRKAGTPGRWELLGDCYMHGMMNGEVFDSQECETIWLE